MKKSRWLRCLVAWWTLALSHGAVAALPPLAPGAVPAQTPDGFAVPQPGTVLPFPTSHGSHPAFRIEWWYITGHLQATDGRRFGFKTTFFRNAGPPLPGEAMPTGGEGPPDTTLGTRHIFLAHTALLDVAGNRFFHQERLNREGWAAWARVGRLDLRNGPWSLSMAPENETMVLESGVGAEVQLDLLLEPQKPRVLFGDRGLSRKGEAPTASSYYITFSRLRASGSVQIDGQAVDVTGLAWMDHEISSNQLDGDQVGWDWACLQLNDGHEIMAYVLRRRDGTPDSASTLAWVDAEGQTRHFGPDAFRWQGRRTWQSPHTGGQYPIEVEITAPDPATGATRRFLLVPLRDDQEMVGRLGGISYYEGACRILDPDTRADLGQAYLELTGYAENLGDRL